jgi:putative flippase GtrA
VRSLIHDKHEFIRFIVTGGVATLCNMVVVWFSRSSLSVSASFVCGLVAGMCASFLLMKTFAFRSKSWSSAKGEAARFLVVYAVGTAVYLVTALATERLLSAASLPIRLAAVGGVFSGGFLMAITSYAGHRHFTYRKTSGRTHS